MSTPVKPTREQIVAIIDAATKAAIDATAAYLTKNGAHPANCGFAWVNIKPARGPYVGELKNRGIGRLDTYYGGLTVWDPSNNPTQDVSAKMAGAEAFAKVLRDAGVPKAHAWSRLD